MSHWSLLTQSVVVVRSTVSNMHESCDPVILIIVYAHSGSIPAYQSGGPTQSCQQQPAVLSVSSQFMPPPYGRNTPGSCTSNTTLEFRYTPDIVAGFGLMSLCPARAVATGFTTRLASGGSAGNDQRRRRA